MPNLDLSSYTIFSIVLFYSSAFSQQIITLDEIHLLSSQDTFSLKRSFKIATELSDVDSFSLSIKGELGSFELSTKILSMLNGISDLNIPVDINISFNKLTDHSFSETLVFNAVKSFNQKALISYTIARAASNFKGDINDDIYQSGIDTSYINNYISRPINIAKTLEKFSSHSDLSAPKLSINNIELPPNFDPFYKIYRNDLLEDCCVFDNCFLNCLDENVFTIAVLTSIWECSNGIVNVLKQFTEFVSRRAKNKPQKTIKEIFEEIINPESPSISSLQISSENLPHFKNARNSWTVLQKCLKGLGTSVLYDIGFCAAECAYDPCFYNGSMCENGKREICIKSTCALQLDGYPIALEVITAQECYPCFGNMNFNDGTANSTTNEMTNTIDIEVDWLEIGIFGGVNCLSESMMSALDAPWDLNYCVNTNCNFNSEFVINNFGFNPYEIVQFSDFQLDGNDIFAITNFNIGDEICISLQPSDAYPNSWQETCYQEYCFNVECPEFELSTLNSQLILSTENWNPILWQDSEIFIELYKKNEVGTYEFISLTPVYKEGDMLVRASESGNLPPGCYNMKIASDDPEEFDESVMKELCISDDWLLDSDYCVEECETYAFDFNVEVEKIYGENESIERTNAVFTDVVGGDPEQSYYLCLTEGQNCRRIYNKLNWQVLYPGNYCFQLLNGIDCDQPDNNCCVSDNVKCINIESCDLKTNISDPSEILTVKSQNNNGGSLTECITHNTVLAHPTGSFNNGSIILQFPNIEEGAIMNYLVDWDQGNGSSSDYTLNNLTSGEYCYTIYIPGCCDENGATESCCSVQNCVTLEAECPNITLPSFTYKRDECQEGNFVMYYNDYEDPSGGEPPYTWEWNAENLSTIPGIIEFSEPTYSGYSAESGNYRVTVTDANGCSMIQTFTEPEREEMPTLLGVTEDVHDCDGRIVRYKVNYITPLPTNPNIRYTVGVKGENDNFPRIERGIPNGESGSLIFEFNPQGRKYFNIQLNQYFNDGIPCPTEGIDIEIPDFPNVVAESTLEIKKKDPNLCDQPSEFILEINCQSEHGCEITRNEHYIGTFPLGIHEVDLGYQFLANRYTLSTIIEDGSKCSDFTVDSYVDNFNNQLLMGDGLWEEDFLCNCWKFVLNIDEGIDPTSLIINPSENSVFQRFHLTYNDGFRIAEVCTEDDGIQCIDVIDQFGCLTQYCNNFKQRELLANVISGPDNTCTPEADGWLKVSVSGGTPPYEFQFSEEMNDFISNTGPSFIEFENLRPGDYSFSFWDSFSCWSSSTEIVRIDECISNQSITDMIIYSNSNSPEFFVLAVDVDDARPPEESVVISWTGPDGFSSSDYSIIPVVSGEYCFTATTCCGDKYEGCRRFFSGNDCPWSSIIYDVTNPCDDTFPFGVFGNPEICIDLKDFASALSDLLPVDLDHRFVYLDFKLINNTDQSGNSDRQLFEDFTTRLPRQVIGPDLELGDYYGLEYCEKLKNNEKENISIMITTSLDENFENVLCTYELSNISFTINEKSCMEPFYPPILGQDTNIPLNFERETFLREIRNRGLDNISLSCNCMETCTNLPTEEGEFAGAFEYIFKEDGNTIYTPCNSSRETEIWCGDQLISEEIVSTTPHIIPPNVHSSFNPVDYDECDVLATIDNDGNCLYTAACEVTFRDLDGTLRTVLIPTTIREACPPPNDLCPEGDGPIIDDNSNFQCVTPLSNGVCLGSNNNSPESPCNTSYSFADGDDCFGGAVNFCYPCDNGECEDGKWTIETISQPIDASNPFADGFECRWMFGCKKSNGSFEAYPNSDSEITSLIINDLLNSQVNDNYCYVMDGFQFNLYGFCGDCAYPLNKINNQPILINEVDIETFDLTICTEQQLLDDCISTPLTDPINPPIYIGDPNFPPNTTPKSIVYSEKYSGPVLGQDDEEPETYYYSGTGNIESQKYFYMNSNHVICNPVDQFDYCGDNNVYWTTKLNITGDGELCGTSSMFWRSGWCACPNNPNMTFTAGWLDGQLEDNYLLEVNGTTRYKKNTKGSHKISDNKDVVLLGFDESGLLQQSQTFGGAGNDVATSITTIAPGTGSTNNIIGGFALTGFFENGIDFSGDGSQILNAVGTDAFVAIFDENGNYLNSINNIVEGFDVRGKSISSDSDGNLILVLSVKSNAQDQIGYSVVVKLDPSLEVLWQANITGGIHMFDPGNIHIDYKNDITVAGSFVGELAAGNQQINLPSNKFGGFVVKFSKTGSLLLLNKVGESDSQIVISGLAEAPNNNLYLSGYYTSDIDFEISSLYAGSATTSFIVKMLPNGMLDPILSLGEEGDFKINDISSDRKGGIGLIGTYAGNLNIGGFDLPSDNGEERGFFIPLSELLDQDKNFDLGILNPAKENESFILDIYPNPFKNQLNIDFYSEQDGEILLEIFFIDGQRLLEKKVNVVKGYNRILIDKELKNAIGLLQLRTTTVNGKVFMDKVIKLD